jgi:hypothetical protein
MDVNRSRAAGLLFSCAGLYGAIFSFQLLMGTRSRSGAGVFPFVVSILLLLSGVLWVVRGNSKREEAGMERPETTKNLATPFKIVVVTLGFVLTLSRLGFLIASPLFMFSLLFWVGRYRFWVAMALAVAFGVGSWSFFAKILAIDLPKGIWNL